MLRRSISSGSTTPRPTATARRRRSRDRRPPPPIPGCPASKGRGGLSKRPETDERRQRGERPPPVPPLGAVVPREPDRLRARARRRDAEPEAMPRPVEEPRALVQAAELPPERAALDRARVVAEAPVPPRARRDDRVGGEHAVFQCGGDALAHDRVAAGGIPA